MKGRTKSLSRCLSALPPGLTHHLGETTISHPHPTTTMRDDPLSDASALRGNTGGLWYYRHPFHCQFCHVKLTRKNWFPRNWAPQDEWYPTRWKDDDKTPNRGREICVSCNSPEATERRDRARLEAAVKALREDLSLIGCNEYLAEKS